jgi:1-acyl-sn-glycerol-3-phosphate acyltransferase
MFHSLIAGPLTRYFARPMKVTGLENLPVAGPVIIAPNHQSDIDTAVLYAALPENWRRRMVAAAARDVVFKYPILGAAARLLFGAFPMERRGLPLASLRICLDSLSEGWSLLLFPEGRLSPDGTLGEFRPGLGLVARASGVPVVLVHMRGTRQILPPGRRRPRRGPVEVQFDRPIFYDGTSAEAFARTLMQRMLTLDSSTKVSQGTPCNDAAST